MAKGETHYVTQNGERIPFNSWHYMGGGISIMPLKTRYRIRDDDSGEVVKPGGQAGNDALMMALYRGEFPFGYAQYAFGWRRAEDGERRFLEECANYWAA